MSSAGAVSSPQPTYADQGETTLYNQRLATGAMVSACVLVALGVLGSLGAVYGLRASASIPLKITVPVVILTCGSLASGASFWVGYQTNTIDELEEDEEGLQDTKLMREVRKGNTVGVWWMLLRGANPAGPPDLHALTPLMVAAENGDVDIIKALLLAGADPDFSIKYPGVEDALYYARINNHKEAARLLIGAGSKAYDQAKRGNPRYPRDIVDWVNQA